MHKSMLLKNVICIIIWVDRMIDCLQHHPPFKYLVVQTAFFHHREGLQRKRLTSAFQPVTQTEAVWQERAAPARRVLLWTYMESFPNIPKKPDRLHDGLYFITADDFSFFFFF